MSLDYVWEVWQVIYALLQNLKNLDLDISEDEEFEHLCNCGLLQFPFFKSLNFDYSSSLLPSSLN